MSMIDGVYYIIRSVVPITHFEKGGHFRNKRQRRSLLLNTISRKKVSSLPQLEMIHHFLIIFLHPFFFGSVYNNQLYDGAAPKAHYSDELDLCQFQLSLLWSCPN